MSQFRVYNITKLTTFFFLVILPPEDSYNTLATSKESVPANTYHNKFNSTSRGISRTWNTYLHFPVNLNLTPIATYPYIQDQSSMSTEGIRFITIMKDPTEGREFSSQITYTCAEMSGNWTFPMTITSAKVRGSRQKNPRYNTQM